MYVVWEKSQFGWTWVPSCKCWTAPLDPDIVLISLAVLYSVIGGDNRELACTVVWMDGKFTIRTVCTVLSFAIFQALSTV